MNNFLKQFLRLWLIHYGSFEGIEKSIVASDLEAVFKRQRKIRKKKKNFTKHK